MEEKPLTWEIWRDAKLCGRARSYQEADGIVRGLRKISPTSSFRLQYVGRNLGQRSPEELIG